MLCLVISPIVLFTVSGAFGVTELEVKEERFILNGKPTFLFGISYYGALGAPRKFIQRDLDDMERLGINWIRVWATWNRFGNDTSVVDDNGSIRQEYLDKLKWLVAECDKRKMVVDVTLSRRARPGLKKFEVHRRTVETITENRQESSRIPWVE